MKGMKELCGIHTAVGGGRMWFFVRRALTRFFLILYNVYVCELNGFLAPIKRI